LRYVIKIKSTALKELDRVPSYISERATDVINHFSIDQRPRGCKKLTGENNLWRVKVGEYRVIYEIDDFQKLIRIRRFLHRKEAYR